MSYAIEPMEPELLERRREHARQNPNGRTAALIGHIDWLERQLGKEFMMRIESQGFRVGKRVKLIRGDVIAGLPQPGDEGVIIEIGEGGARVLFDEFPLNSIIYEYDQLELI